MYLFRAAYISVGYIGKVQLGVPEPSEQQSNSRMFLCLMV